MTLGGDVARERYTRLSFVHDLCMSGDPPDPASADRALLVLGVYVYL